MKSHKFAVFSLLLFSGVCPGMAEANAWTLVPAEADKELQFVLSDEVGIRYAFVCESQTIRVTNFGVTKLMDLQTGTTISDEAGAVITPGASFMALYTGKGDPEFLAADVKPSSEKGWDVTLRFDKKDKRLDALTKAEVISLFTTGYTIAVEMGKEDHLKAREFLTSCRKTQ
jgi:hypothetical protein